MMRVCGALLLAGSVAAVLVDGTRSFEASRLVLTTVQQSWLWLSPDASLSLGSSSRAALLSPMATLVRSVPICVALGAVGLLLLAAGRPRAPGIGYVAR